MRTLSATLTAAQKSQSAHPCVEIEVHNKIAGVERLSFTRLYTGAEAEADHVLCVVTKGTEVSMVRARRAGGGTDIYY